MKKFTIILTVLIAMTITTKAQWTTQTNGTNNVLTSVYFTDANTGYVVGGIGTILNTTDGTNWAAQTSGTTDNLNSVCFNGPYGAAVGNFGTTLKTNDHGSSWAAVSSGTNGHLLSVCQLGQWFFAVGSSGVILRSNNWGTTWATQTSGTSYWLFSVDVHYCGLAVGAGGTILKTDNHIDWTAQTSGTTNNLNSVWFIDANANTGYAVGDNGTVIKTINGGTTWIAQTSGTTQKLNSVYFTNVNTGCAVGNSGIILATIDGGTTWTAQTSGTTNNLNSVFFTDDNTGYAVGSNGTILKTVTGGWCTGQCQLSGIICLCHPTASSQYATSSATNATSYIWEITPSGAGTISGTDTIGTVIWNPAFTGVANISVKGSNGTCYGPRSDVTVTIVTSTTGPFNLTSPANGASASATPLFTWGASSGANYYRLFVDGVLKKDNIITNSYQLNSNEALSQGVHTWYVTAGGCPIQSNDTWSVIVDATQPTVFNLVSPSDNSWTTSLLPTFTWSASSDANSGLAKYQLWIDGSLAVGNISASATSANPNYDLSNGTHTWMIKAIDNVGNIRNSTQTWTIKVDNLPPQICVLKNPSDNQYLAVTTPAFSWGSTTDAGIGFQKFQLFIDGNMVKDNLSDSSWTVTTPLAYGQHTWFIKVFDSLANNQSTSSRIFYIDNAKPFAFSLTSPIDSQGVALPTPNLSWQTTTDSTGGSGLRKYQLWIDGVKNRDSIPTTQTTVAPSSALAQGVYTWFLKAYDKVGNVRQSTEIWTLYVDWVAPTAFTLIDPADNATSTVSRPLFKWHSSSDIGSGLQRYELYISGQTPITVLPSDTTKLMTFDLPNSTYAWYVKAYDRANNSTSSNTYTLTINDPLPNQAATPTGANEFCNNAINTDFTTTGANNATSYIWEIMPSGAGTISGTGLIGTVDWNNTYLGTAQITVKGHNGSGDGMASAPNTVTVYPATVAGSISGSCNVCIGDSTGTLTLSGHTGNIIKWQERINSGAWFDIINTNATYSEVPSTIGVWEYRAEIQSGVCSSLFSSSVTINVEDIPANAGVINGLTTVCQDQDSVTYTVTAITNATSYNWTLPIGATGTSTSNSITVKYGISTVSGNITVNGTNTCGNGASSSLTITVNNKPPTPIITLNIDIIQSDATTGNQWYDQNGILDGLTYQEFHCKNNGDYYVIVTINGCSSDTSNIIHIIDAGIEFIENNKTINVYPNPASDIVTLNIDNIDNADLTLNIYNVIGTLVKSEILKQNQRQINIGDLSNGVYMVSIKTKDWTDNQRLIIQR